MNARMILPLLLALAGMPALAEPQAAPPPAKTWRNAGFSPYLWYPTRQWRSDFGVAGGRCNSAEVGFLARGMLRGGGISPWEDRPVAVVLGRVLGPALDARLGRDADAADRGCLGHVLELAPDDHRVGWSNHGLNFSIRALHGAVRGGRFCRGFEGRVLGRDLDMPIGGMACRGGRGVWLMV